MPSRLILVYSYILRRVKRRQREPSRLSRSHILMATAACPGDAFRNDLDLEATIILNGSRHTGVTVSAAR